MKFGKVLNAVVILATIPLLIACGRERTSSTDVTLMPSDKIFVNRVFFDALNNANTEDRLEWHNRETGNAGAIVLDATYLNTTGLYCRRFREEVEIPLGAIPNWFNGRACKNKYGVWVRQ